MDTRVKPAHDDHSAALTGHPGQQVMIFTDLLDADQ